VLVTDAAANGYANYVLDSSQGATAGRIGESAITALAVAVLAAASGYGLGSSPTIYPTHAVPQMCHTPLLRDDFERQKTDRKSLSCGNTGGAGRT
jgi:hypothetical protein